MWGRRQEIEGADNVCEFGVCGKEKADQAGEVLERDGSGGAVGEIAGADRTALSPSWQWTTTDAPWNGWFGFTFCNSGTG